MVKLRTNPRSIDKFKFDVSIQDNFIEFRRMIDNQVVSSFSNALKGTASEEFSIVTNRLGTKVFSVAFSKRFGNTSTVNKVVNEVVLITSNPIDRMYISRKKFDIIFRSLEGMNYPRRWNTSNVQVTA